MEQPAKKPKLIVRIIDYLSWLAVPAIWIMVLVVVVNTIGRTVFHKSLVWSTSLESLMAGIITFCAMAAAYREGRMISSDFMVAKFKGRLRFAIDIFGLLLGLVCYIIMFWTGSSNVSEDMATGLRPNNMDMPLWPWEIIVPIGIASLIIAMIVDLVNKFRQADKIT